MKRLSVKVKPNSKQQQFKVEEDGSLTVHLKSPPVDGKANAELIQLLAKNLGVPKSAISIRVGASAKLKIIEIDTD